MTKKPARCEFALSYTTPQGSREGALIFEDGGRGFVTVSAIIGGGKQELGRILRKDVVRAGKFFEE